MKDEIEIKVALSEDEVGPLQNRLLELGFEQTTPRTFEENLLFDFPDSRLESAGSACRLRRYGSKQILTFKGPKKSDPHLKIREEIETEVGDFGDSRRLLEHLGLIVGFEYSKYRQKLEKWDGSLKTECCIDETPVGCFLEIEGSRENIEDLARRLGIERSQFITANYIDLYRQKDTRE
jgi:adenylate cyclase class 2